MLEHTLGRVLPQAEAAGAEIIVVDNASTDDTPAVLGKVAHHSFVTALREPQLGLSRARNRGLAQARGEIAVFLDDDAVPRPRWLHELLAAYSKPEVGCVGGRILLHFTAPPPAWLTSALHSSLSGYDLGDTSRRVANRRDDEYPYGANISFRTAVARSLGGFSILMGLRGRIGLQQEETDLCFRIDRSGMELHYAAAAVVDHWISEERLSPRWFLQRFWLHGKSNAAFQVRNRGVRPALGILRRHYATRLLVASYVPHEPIDAVRFLTECRRREALGYVIGLARGVARLRPFRRSAADNPPLRAVEASPPLSRGQAPWQ
jgi:glycosyltransferase involved in cell wall biosynthesis